MGYVYSNGKQELCINLNDDDYLYILSVTSLEILKVTNKDGVLIFENITYEIEVDKDKTIKRVETTKRK